MGKCCKRVAPCLSVTPFWKWQSGWLESMNTSPFWCSLQRNASGRRKPAGGLLLRNSRSLVHALEGELPLWYFACVWRQLVCIACELASSDRRRKGVQQIAVLNVLLEKVGVSCSSKPHEWSRMLGWLEDCRGGWRSSGVSQSIRAAHRQLVTSHPLRWQAFSSSSSFSDGGSHFMKWWTCRKLGQIMGCPFSARKIISLEEGE